MTTEVFRKDNTSGFDAAELGILNGIYAAIWDGSNDEFKTPDFSKHIQERIMNNADALLDAASLESIQIS